METALEIFQWRSHLDREVGERRINQVCCSACSVQRQLCEIRHPISSVWLNQMTWELPLGAKMHTRYWSWKVIFINHLSNINSSTAQDAISYKVMFTFSLSKLATSIPLCLGKEIRSFAEPWPGLGFTSLVTLEDEQAPLKRGWREAERHNSLIQFPLVKAGE